MLRTTKPPKCKHCRRRLERIGQRLHDECVDAWITRQRAKQDAAKKRAQAEAKRKDRADTRARKDKLKTVSDWEDECRRIVQAIARIRDRHDGCISCHMGANYGGKWNGSHFRSVGACSSLQFHLWNIHKACVQCNMSKGGNIAAYRPRLVEKIGADRVDWLERQNGVTKRSGPAYIEYLQRFKRVMGKRMRRQERSARRDA
jgi:hypothetical protein